MLRFFCAYLQITPEKLIIKQTKNIHNEFELGEVLGCGHLGVTRVAIHKKDGKKFACKTISKDKLRTQEEIESVRQEIQIMHVLSGHEHIVQIVDFYEEKLYVHIVMELCTGGELLAFIMEKVLDDEDKVVLVLFYHRKLEVNLPACNLSISSTIAWCWLAFS